MWYFSMNVYMLTLSINCLYSNLKFFLVPICCSSTGIHFMQLTAVHLVDAHLCSDPGKYVSALVLSLSTMLHLELPHVNVLSKIDLIESYGKLGTNNILLIRV